MGPHARRQRMEVDPRAPEARAREVLLLVSSDWAIEPPQPLPPAVKMVGAIPTRPAQPLPTDLEAWPLPTLSMCIALFCLASVLSTLQSSQVSKPSSLRQHCCRSTHTYICWLSLEPILKTVCVALDCVQHS